MKNLANCKPTEFFAQTVKIRRYVEDWLSATKIMEIRTDLPVPPENATKEEKQALLESEVKKRCWKLFDSIFEENAEKTIGLIALVCFIDPKDADNYEVGDYLQNIAEIINDERVLGFFTSLLNLDQLSTSNASEA